MRRSWKRALRERLKTIRRLAKRGGLYKISGGLVILTAASACDTWGPHDTVTSPSNDPALTASISAPITSTTGDPSSSVHIIPFRCSNGVRFTGPIDIAMTAGHDVNLHQVTIRLGNSEPSGPAQGAFGSSNSFDSDELSSAFGSTQIPGGTVRTLRFRTDLWCGQPSSDFVAAEIQFTEASGQKNSVMVTAPFGSATGLGSP
jgi:hypothetical protein